VPAHAQVHRYLETYTKASRLSPRELEACDRLHKQALAAYQAYLVRLQHLRVHSELSCHSEGGAGQQAQQGQQQPIQRQEFEEGGSEKQDDAALLRTSQAASGAQGHGSAATGCVALAALHAEALGSLRAFQHGARMGMAGFSLALRTRGRVWRGRAPAFVILNGRTSLAPQGHAISAVSWPSTYATTLFLSCLSSICSHTTAPSRAPLQLSRTISAWSHTLSTQRTTCACSSCCGPFLSSIVVCQQPQSNTALAASVHACSGCGACTRQVRGVQHSCDGLWLPAHARLLPAAPPGAGKVGGCTTGAQAW